MQSTGVAHPSNCRAERTLEKRRYLCTNPVTYDTSKERCAFKDGLHKSLRFAVSVVG